ncbi:hypothetical protein ZWY2020_028003 [Hordeum vulgare]|nr:hypothetical protein ZWY2020_028003 [Hordeum vulgare]
MAAPVYPVFNLPPWFRPQGGNKEGTGAQQQEKGAVKEGGGDKRRKVATDVTMDLEILDCPVCGSNARVTWSDPVAAETREVPDVAAHPFDRKLVSTQRLVKEQAAIDKEKSRWEQQF